MNAQFDITGITLETERLILRPWTYDDLDDFYEYASNPDVGPMAGWEPHKDKQASLEILKRFVEHKKTFAIVYKENMKAIGSLGIEFYELEDKLTEFKDLQGRSIGYVLSKDYWGRGLMPEAVKAVIDFLFNPMLIVLERKILLMYVPFAAAGFSLIMVEMNSLAFSKMGSGKL